MYCRNKKGDFENKIFDWIMAEASTTKSAEPEKVLDDVDHGLGSIAVMIRRDLNVRDRTRLLFELQWYAFDFISLRVDATTAPQRPVQQLQQPVPVPQNPLMFTQEQSQQPESFISMLQPLN